LSRRRTAIAKTERKPDHGDEKLYALRHSTAHVMAGAVLDLIPDAKFGFGPPIADGFYYDFDVPRPLQPEDLGKIEAKMPDVPFEHRDMSVPEALEFFRGKKQLYKVEQIEKLAAEGASKDSDDEVEDGKVSLYQHNGFVDLCRGPHVKSTGEIKAFKLLSIAGAYWRGNERNPQLQRIYGTVWPSQAELDAYMAKLAEIGPWAGTSSCSASTKSSGRASCSGCRTCRSCVRSWRRGGGKSTTRAATRSCTPRTSPARRSTSAPGTSRSTARTCTGHLY
jgi:threonyl-tRNA synthetase